MPRTEEMLPLRHGRGRETLILRQALHHSGQGFGQVVVDDHDCEQYEEDEGGLVDAFFDLQADVAAHHAFDEKQQDYAAVEDGNGKQVEDAEVQADRGGESHQRGPAFFGGGFAGSAANPDGTFDGANGNFPLNHLLDEFQNQQGTFFVLLDRSTECCSQRERTNFHYGG